MYKSEQIREVRIISRNKREKIFHGGKYELGEGLNPKEKPIPPQGSKK